MSNNLFIQKSPIIVFSKIVKNKIFFENIKKDLFIYFSNNFNLFTNFEIKKIIYYLLSFPNNEKYIKFILNFFQPNNNNKIYDKNICNRYILKILKSNNLGNKIDYIPIFLDYVNIVYFKLLLTNKDIPTVNKILILFLEKSTNIQIIEELKIINDSGKIDTYLLDKSSINIINNYISNELHKKNIQNKTFLQICEDFFNIYPEMYSD